MQTCYRGVYSLHLGKYVEHINFVRGPCHCTSHRCFLLLHLSFFFICQWLTSECNSLSSCEKMYAFMLKIDCKNLLRPIDCAIHNLQNTIYLQIYWQNFWIACVWCRLKPNCIYDFSIAMNSMYVFAFDGAAPVCWVGKLFIWTGNYFALLTVMLTYGVPMLDATLKKRLLSQWAEEGWKHRETEPGTISLAFSFSSRSFRKLSNEHQFSMSHRAFTFFPLHLCAVIFFPAVFMCLRSFCLDVCVCVCDVVFRYGANCNRD